jgi:YegS/Rv2252/BmrU family lipid kinase
VTTIIFNPTARGEKSRAFLASLTSLGREAALKPTTAAGHAVQLARESIEEGSTTVVAAGGDGTVNEVVNGLATAPGGLTQARLGILPLGTVNVFARELRIPQNFSKAWRIIASGAEKIVDLPYADLKSKSGDQRRYFVQMAGAGLDSRAIGLVQWELKKKIGPLAYLWASIQAMRAEHPIVRVQVNGSTVESPLVCVGNGRFLGGSFPVFPHAQLRDGRIDVVAFRAINWFVFSRVFVRLLTDRFASSGDAQFFQSDQVRLDAREDIQLQVEGDNVGPLPVAIGVNPSALRVCSARKD